MASYFAQKYRDLYKVHNAADSTVRQQADRRQHLLKLQRKQRDEAVDESRGLVQAIENYSLPNYDSNRLPYRVDLFYRNKVQLSEWLRDRPVDLDQWVLVPCPRGKRHLVVAASNKTIAYSKSGAVVDIFQSSLQSGRYLTVLDCIYSDVTQTFYVLDVLVYHNREFLLCEAAFRFYWIRSKFDEFDHGSVHRGNQYAFHHIDRADFDHPEEVDGLLSRWPLWEENQPGLDGFLLYHKQAHYTHGKTPLVGWLLPWMVPEMLGYAVNGEYVKQRPSNGLKALEFMADFDEQRKVGQLGGPQHQQQQKKRHFFNAKKKNRSGNNSGGGDVMDVQQEGEEEMGNKSGGTSSWRGDKDKQQMDVHEAVVVVVELDGLDVVEYEEDEAVEELRQQRGFDEDDDLEDDNDDDGLDDQVGMELLDSSNGGGDRQPMTRKHKNNISKHTNQQVVGDQKRISTVFKF